MRPAAFAVWCVVLCGACEGATTPTVVEWMEWPAVVAPQQPFPVRLIAYWPCAASGFESGASTDQSAVTFAPFFLKAKNDAVCIAALAIGAFDTTVTAPALPGAAGPRTYEMRAPLSVSAVNASQSSLPLMTFGEIVVQSSNPDPSRRNVGGQITLEKDSLNCVRVRPYGVFRSDGALVLENPTDTAGLSYHFVQGYLYQPSAPVCGETTVFHLTNRL